MLHEREDDGNEKNHKETKNWKKEKEVFELQLNQLQEQLVAAMVQNQQLGLFSLYFSHFFLIMVTI